MASINEIRISSGGSSDDTSNFIELFGEPGEALTDQALIVISGEFAPGAIDFAFDISGGTTDADGVFLLGNPGAYDFDAGDVTADFDFFGSPSTVLLVEGFTGSAGDDLDTDNDGTFDVMPWTRILDGVSFVDGDGTPDFSYASSVVGPDGNFAPAGAARSPDGTGDFEQLDFGDQSSDTPGETNVATADFTLELLHFTDQEAASAAVTDAPNLSAVLNALRAQDVGDDGLPDNTLTLSSGDAFIPSLFFNASEAVYGSAGIADIQIQNELGVQAIALGNHEFDFGTATLAGLIDGSAEGSILDADFAGAMFPYLSTNLDFSTDENLAPLEIEGGQAPQANAVTSSTVIDVNGESIGVVGATTPTLGSISSPGGVGISPSWAGTNPTAAELDALAAEIQSEVDALLAANEGMDKVVLLAHMQQISIELGLAERLENVDVIVAGGSNTRLFDDNDRVRDGDSDQGEYPQFVTNAGGTTTAVVNTDGSYKYVGRLVIDFDADGNIIADSYDAEVSGAYATDAQGVADLGAEDLVDPEVQQIADAIEAQIIATESNVFGYSEVFLNGNRSGTFDGDDPDGVRTQETNLGNLTADANLWAAQQEDASVVVSIKNGGGIRASIGETLVPANATEAVRTANSEVVDGDGNVIKAEGGISQNDIETALAFNNGLVALTLTKQELVAVLEHGVASLPDVAGSFAQVSGVEFSFDPDLPSGSRIVDAEIVDGNGNVVATLVEDGEIAGDASETFRVVTLNFLAEPRFADDGTFIGGGDGYPYPNTNTDPSVGETADAETLARINLVSLVEDGERDGDATFADNGTEQDAFAEYLDDVYGTPEEAFDQADTGAEADSRIENLAFEVTTPEGTGEIELTRIGAFDSGSGEGGSEVVAFDADRGLMFTTNGEDDRIDVTDLADPANPVLVTSIDLDGSVADYDGIQSVAVSGTTGAVAVAREDAEGNPLPGAVVLFDLDSLEITGSIDVGYLPDMVTFTHDGARILVANEGEPGDNGDVPGGVSIIDVATGAVTNVGFEGFDHMAEQLAAEGVRIFPEEDGSLKMPSLDFEPEYITVSPDGQRAFVTLQEANAVAVLDLTYNAFVDILPLGTIDHSLPGNELDASDEDGEINIANWPLKGMHMPDAIASYAVGGQTYFVTANEGDARDADERVEDLDLDPDAFPDAETLQQEENLGRIEVSTIDGDTDGDGDYDELYSYGTRSFSIFDAEGNRVFDSGSQFEKIIADLRVANAFNNDDYPSDDAGELDENRSDNKGPEPEAVTVGEVNGEIYAFIGLERDSGIMVYNVTDPENASFVQYINSVDDGDISPETLHFISAEDSPSGEPLLLAANEVSGTTAIYNIDFVTPISTVQGAGHRSPLDGQTVTLEGVVTALDGGSGYYIQSVQGDGDDATSEGIYIDATPGVQVGDLVRVKGTVSERKYDDDLPVTILEDVSSTSVRSSGNALPEAIVIGPDGLLPPVDHIDDDGLTVFEPGSDAIDFFESLEGMRVTLQAGAHVVAGTNQYGEIAVSLNGEGDTAAGGLRLRGANGEIIDANPERIIIDEALYGDDQAVPSVTTGDTLNEVTGVLDYAFGEFKLLATEAPTVQTEGGFSRETTTVGTDDATDLTVATYNVLNLDPGDADEKFAQLAEDIVANLGAPGIIGLQEIQDNDGPTDSGVVAADETYQKLIDAIVAEGGPEYAFIDSTPEDKADGGQPGANIRVGFLYDPSVATLVGDPVRIEGDLDPNGAFDEDPTPGDGVNENFAGTRKPLAATFEVDGEEVTVIVAHFKSKSGDTPLSGEVQPPVEVSEAQRVAQAQVVNDYVDSLLADDPQAKIMVVGDFNDFEFSDPLLALAGDALTNLTDLMPEEDRYSYQYNGNSQTLDHILVSDALLAGAVADAVHVNADFPADDAASDHDPIVAGFDFDAAGSVGKVDGVAQAPSSGGVLEGDDGANQIVGSSGGDLIMAGLGRDTLLLGSGGADRVAGETGDFDGDIVVGFGADDAFVFEGQALRASDVVFDAASGALSLGGETLTLVDAELGGGSFMVVQSETDGMVSSTVQYVDGQVALGEGVAVDAADVNGIVPEGFLSGDNAAGFTVELDTAGARYENVLGYFTRDAETGAIEAVEILFGNAKAAGAGAVASIEGLEAGDALGFFMVQDGADLLAGLDGEIGLAVQDGVLRLTEDGLALEDALVFNSLDAGLNADGLQHVLSGAAAEGSGLEVGFEDKFGGGDMDFQDVTFTVTPLEDAPLV